nr:MAG TPA: Protein of unknown function (DUF3199) [Caudoviricetes sp.]
MLEQVLRHLNNWFLVEIHEGTFTVENGSITLPFLQTNQYFRICGSVFNDGLHQYPVTDLTDGTFTGTVWVLAVPKAVVTLSEDIAAWEKKNGEAVLSPYTSESFGGYSYTKASGGKADTSAVTGWQDAFKSRLNDWRKLKGVEP